MRSEIFHFARALIFDCPWCGDIVAAVLAMSTLDLIDKLLTIGNEVLWPALGLWVAYLVRKWVGGSLSPPPYQHTVTLQDTQKK